MTDEKNPAPPPAPVRLVRTSPEVNALRRDLLRHALDEGSFARYITENFRRNDFPGCGDIFDALKRSVQETGGVDRNLIGNAVGWDDFYGFERRLPEIVLTGDHWDVAKSEMRKQIRTALHDAVRDQDDDRAFALVERLREPAVAPVAPTPATPEGEVTEASIEAFMRMVEQNSKRELLGFRTSLWALDKATSGLVGGETWGVVAPTGVGKTTIASQFVNEVALQGGRAMYISLEMPARRILARLVGANTALNPRKIFEGKSGMPPEFMRGKVRFFAATRTVIRDDLVELGAIEKFVQGYVASGEPLDLIVIDFLQNVNVRNVNTQIERCATSAVRLQSLARATGTCIVVLSQMSNEAVAAKGRGILNARYSSELIQASDVFIELVKDDKTGNVELLVRKNRSGEHTSIILRWTTNYSRFETAI